MSLINDALKRARQVQQNNPGASSLHLRAAEPQPVARRISKVMLLIFGIVLLIPGGFILWMRFHPSRPAPAEKAVGDAEPAQPAITPAAAAVSAPGVLPVQAKTIDPAPGPVLEGVAEPPRLRPLPPRLQAIVFDPQRPSAIIDGKTVFVNGRIGDMRVTAISASSVTLANGFRTNILTLGQ